MKYVIIRDDDTHPLTPIDCLERLYRPFLDRGLPVNLATIPCVRTDAEFAPGVLEGFLLGKSTPGTRPIADNPALLEYLRANPGFRIVQHGYHHDLYEFERHPRQEIARRLDHGTELLREAGFEAPETFVAPYDRISRDAYRELAKRFGVISTGWFELNRLPPAWWPAYFLKKAWKRAHWQVGRTRLLGHPGCLLSYQRPFGPMVDTIRKAIAGQRVTVLVTHWWEYFYNGNVNEPFIEKLHETAEYLAGERDIEVISFSDLIKRGIPLH